MLALRAVSPHNVAGSRASRSFAPLGSTKLGSTKLAAADDGPAALDSAAEGAACDAAADGWAAAVDGLDAADPPQPHIVTSTAPVASAPMILRVPIWISSRQLRGG